jgi:chromosome segregation ATPase
MNLPNLKTMALAGIVILGIAGCNSPKQKAEKLENAEENVIEAQQELNEAVIDSTNEYDRFKAESEAKLIANDVKIAALKDQLKTDKKEIRTKYEKQLTELEQKNAKLKSNIAEYKETDKSNWEKFKVSFNEDLDALGKAISGIATDK